MTATIIDGKAIAADVRAQVALRVAALPEQPGLATVLVGDDPASAVYVRNKRKQCVQAGIRDHHRLLRGDVTQAEAESVITELAEDSDVHGILLQLPLPSHLDETKLINLIPADKDVDGLTEISAGRLALGRRGLQPCTPQGVVRLLDEYGVELSGVRVVVVGRSDLVGKPAAALLLQRNATVTVCHSKTVDLDARCAEADVLVVAAGVPRLIGTAAIKPGAVVIDVGIHRTDAGLCGDVDGEARDVAGALTPVPGGVGPMTIAMLLQNTVDAAERQMSAPKRI